ncbi:MAG: PorP/SprF family type IX secretion system membrane protein [Bacteroidales bacterium]|nr:PorP/SprF family type IX secretion system membrane protein [Bacteroidales bacterium]
MIKINKYFITFLLNTLILHGQDTHFSQFYINSIYLSPSFTGSTNGTRVTNIFRNQWPGIPKSYISYAISLDHFLQKFNSGCGFLLLNDVAGEGKLGTTLIGFNYTYQLNVSYRYKLRPGIQIYRFTRKIDFYRLTFGDQLNFSGNNPTSVEVPTLNNTSNIDATLSLLFYTKKYWIGFTTDHILAPNESLKDGYSKVPLKVNIFSGCKHNITHKTGSYNEQSLNFWVLYYFQQKFDQLQIGAYLNKYPYILGFWYRGMMVIKKYASQLLNNDALIFQVGYVLNNNLKINYSYDLTISRLGPATLGAHEISLVFEFNQEQKYEQKIKKEIIPCPKY